ncbi:hypothetical protein BBG7_1740 [Bifidobacterium longum]|nr:hypothetical protein BBG7_1740 [Bifidobacterium longum]
MRPWCAVREHFLHATAPVGRDYGSIASHLTKLAGWTRPRTFPGFPVISA